LSNNEYEYLEKKDVKAINLTFAKSIVFGCISVFGFIYLFSEINFEVLVSVIKLFLFIGSMILVAFIAYYLWDSAWERRKATPARGLYRLQDDRLDFCSGPIITSFPFSAVEELKVDGEYFIVVLKEHDDVTLPIPSNGEQFMFQLRKAVCNYS